MTTVVAALRPGFRLAKLEGDAAFAYQLADRLDGAQLLDTVERTYFAFRRRLRDIDKATACECNACTDGWVHDLGAAWTAELERRRVVVTERDTGFSFEMVHQAPRDLVWSYMTEPALRPLWQFGVTSVDELPTAPRRGVGTTNHCMHGADVVIEEILDWRPIDYVTLRTTLPNGFKATSTYEFEDDPDGTRLRKRFTWGKNRREREELSFVPGMLAGIIEPGQAKLHEVLAEEMARRAAVAADAPAEPAAPESQGRELLEPIKR